MEVTIIETHGVIWDNSMLGQNILKSLALIGIGLLLAVIVVLGYLCLLKVLDVPDLTTFFRRCWREWRNRLRPYDCVV